MIGLPLGLLYANAGEWAIHKYVLHGHGRSPTSPWAYHLHEHHLAVSRLGGHDPAYKKLRPEWNGQTKELLGLSALAAAHLPLAPVAPWFTAGVLFSIGRYYYVHRRSHLDPAWGRAHAPWHTDHHLGPNQERNWCVTWPWFDHILGTREAYVGTDAERLNRDRGAASVLSSAEAGDASPVAPAPVAV